MFIQEIYKKYLSRVCCFVRFATDALRLNICYLFFWYLIALIPESFAQELRDVRDPVDLPELPWLWIIGGILALGLLTKLWINYKNKPKRKFVKDSWVIALEDLQILSQYDLPSKGKGKEFFVELTGIVRRYIEQRFNIRAPEMTTEEFLEKMKTSSILDEKHKEILKDLFLTADMVKFARYQPEAERAKLCYESVYRMVNETKLTMTESVVSKTKV